MSAQLQLFEAHDPAERWNVRISRRARRLSVRVYPGGRVEVVAPPGASPATIQKFVGTHRVWIERRVEDLSAIRGAMAECRPTLIELAALERTYSVEYRPAAARTVSVRSGGEGWLVVSGRLDSDRLIGQAVRDWLEVLAFEELGRELRKVAESGNFSYRRVQIRRQRTRWGSCSASGTISLNVCLLFLPPPVVRYLLVHELCHTRQMNHSPRFWSLVETHEPEYRRLDRELLRGWQHVPGWMFG